MRISGRSVLVISIIVIELLVLARARPIEKQQKRPKKAVALELQSEDVRIQLNKTFQQYWNAVKSHLTPRTKQKRNKPAAVRQSFYETHKNMTSLPPVIEVFSTANKSTEVEVELMKTLDALQQVNHTLSKVSLFWTSEINETCVKDRDRPASICHMKCDRHSHRRAELALICRLETKDLPRLDNLIRLVQIEVRNKTQCKPTQCLQQHVNYVNLDLPQNNVQLRSLSVAAVSYANLRVAAVESGLENYSTMQKKSEIKHNSH